MELYFQLFKILAHPLDYITGLGPRAPAPGPGLRTPGPDPGP